MAGRERRRWGIGPSSVLGSLLRLAGKDYLVALRASTFYVVVGLPLLVSLGVRYLAKAARPRPAKVAVVGPGARRLADLLQKGAAGLGGLRLKPEVLQAEAQALAKLRKGRLHGLVVLPAGFWKDLREESRPEVVLYYDEAGGASSAALAPLLREVFRALAGQVDPVALQVRGIRHMAQWKALLPAFVVMVLLSAVTLMPSAIAAERQEGTLRTLLAAPVDLWQVVVAKAAFGVGTGLLGALAVLGANGALGGNLPVVGVVCLLGALVSSLLGLLVGLAVESPQAASALASLVYVPLVWGAFFADFGGAIGRVSRWTPGYHVAKVLKEALFMEAGWRRASGPLAGLAVAAFCLGLATVWLLRREEERL